ncbi:hypothetical protein TNCV_1627501 [Trichonephila clavipes]|nr:hypothetical protein TNCV_1627501 [Trichonephila clavipes]
MQCPELTLTIWILTTFDEEMLVKNQLGDIVQSRSYTRHISDALVQFIPHSTQHGNINVINSPFCVIRKLGLLHKTQVFVAPLPPVAARVARCPVFDRTVQSSSC